MGRKIRQQTRDPIGELVLLILQIAISSSKNIIVQYKSAAIMKCWRSFHTRTTTTLSLKNRLEKHGHHNELASTKVIANLYYLELSRSQKTRWCLCAQFMNCRKWELQLWPEIRYENPLFFIQLFAGSFTKSLTHSVCLLPRSSTSLSRSSLFAARVTRSYIVVQWAARRCFLGD